jgi:release factor glutamine methyltransferase
VQISELLEDATDRLSAAGVNSPSVDSELLAAFVLGITRAELTMLTVTGREFPSEKIAVFDSALRRRIAREPLQHITGLAPFRHLELEVGKGVFTPRPETEVLVSAAVELCQGIENPLMVDLCSGSGAIAVALATEVGGANVFAVEKSELAFGYLNRNFQKYGLDTQKLRLGDLADSLDELAGQVDLVVSNPPYIPDSAVPVDLEVQLHEPALALYGGEDGLDEIRRISTHAQTLVKPGGWLLLEHADTQAKAVGELLLADGWEEISSRKDLAGKDRITLAHKR